MKENQVTVLIHPSAAFTHLLGRLGCRTSPSFAVTVHWSDCETQIKQIYSAAEGSHSKKVKSGLKSTYAA